MTTLFATPVMLALNSLMVLFTVWVLSLNPDTRRSRGIVAAALFVWLAVLHGIISTESVLPSDISGVAFYAVILAGVALVGALLLGIKPVREVVLAMNQRQLMMLQGIRVYFGATFLIQGGLGLLPATFGVIDGLSHVSAGFFALIAAFAIALGAQGRRNVWFANAFGLGDILVVATSLAFVLLKDIGPHHPMMYAVFLPAPLWLWAHVVSIYKLLTDSREKDTPTDGQTLTQMA